MVSQLIVEDETGQKWVIDPTDPVYELIDGLPVAFIKVPRALLVELHESQTENTSILDQKDVLNDSKVGDVIKTQVYNHLTKNVRNTNTPTRRLPSEFLLHVEGRVER
mgnify:FL=1|tara:strand:- start:917 stop:1240 length:324 start_codon:yes stop_codon:yes gene_type:complete